MIPNNISSYRAGYNKANEKAYTTNDATEGSTSISKLNLVNYSNRLNQLLTLLENNMQQLRMNQIYKELKETVKELNQQVNNEQIISNNNNEEKNTNNMNSINSMTNMNELNDEIKKLKEENVSLNEKIIQFDKRDDNEISVLKLKIKNLSVEKENLEGTKSLLENLNNELKNKLEIYKDNDSQVKNQEKIIDNLKSQIDILTSENKTKQNTIEYLENIILKYKAQNNEHIHNELSGTGMLSSNKSVNFSDDESSNFASSNLMNSNLTNTFQMSNNNLNDNINGNIFINKDFMYNKPLVQVRKNNRVTEDREDIQNEIDVLDQEIITLKNKLNNMIQ